MRLDWPDCHNARDLGGLRTADGQTVRRRALIRSDRLDRLTEAGVAAVRAHGVSIIDLLDHVDDSYGGPVPYLAGIGMDPDRLATLRARLLA